MPWTPRGGKALSRAASGRVPGPRTTNSCVKGIMLLIIFVIMLMVASFEHSLAAAAHKIGLDKDVEFAAHLALISAEIHQCVRPAWRYYAPYR